MTMATHMVLLRRDDADWFRWAGAASSDDEAIGFAMDDALTALLALGAGVAGAARVLPDDLKPANRGPAMPDTIPEIRIAPAMRAAAGRPQDATGLPPTPWTKDEAIEAIRATLRLATPALATGGIGRALIRIGGTLVKDREKTLIQDLATLTAPPESDPSFPTPDFAALGAWRPVAIVALVGAMASDYDAHGLAVEARAPESATLRALSATLAAERERRERALLTSFARLAGIEARLPDAR